MMAGGNVIGAREDFPAKDLRDVIAMAKAKPGTVRVAVVSAGNKMSIALLEQNAGVKFIVVPFKQSNESANAVLGGFVDLYIETVPNIKAQKGKLKPLAYGGPVPTPQLPGVPLMRDLYKVESSFWFGMVAAAGTQPLVINKVNAEVIKALKTPEVSKLLDQGGLSYIGNNPEEFAKQVRTEYEEAKAILQKHPDIR
jgi:tripartite-type tricarboxylate transporter receptor subunit TctC